MKDCISKTHGSPGRRKPWLMVLSSKHRRKESATACLVVEGLSSDLYDQRNLATVLYSIYNANVTLATTSIVHYIDIQPCHSISATGNVIHRYHQSTYKVVPRGVLLQVPHAVRASRIWRDLDGRSGRDRNNDINAPGTHPFSSLFASRSIVSSYCLSLLLIAIHFERSSHQIC